MSALHLPAGSATGERFELEVTQTRAGWEYSALRVLTLTPGGSLEFATGDEELMVVPLNGSCVVSVSAVSVDDGDRVQRFELAGRDDVFSAVTDCLYAPRDATVQIESPSGGRFALPAARCTRRLPVRYRAADEVPVELRGAGNCSRQVNNFCSADSFEADRLIAVEVLTPGGNWSSYPPHKHDEHRPGSESVLEEIYYFEVSRTPGDFSGSEEGSRARKTSRSREGVGYHRVYGTRERSVDVLAEVRSGDVVLVPHGWHGPSMAAPGYDLYYLNVMAGPDEDRAWHISDDPTFAWVRDTWAGQPIDPRLPLTGHSGGPRGLDDEDHRGGPRGLDEGRDT